MVGRIGCLGILAAWALLGTYIQLTGGFGEEGGGKLAIIGLLGVALFVIASTIDSLAAWIRRRRQPPGET